MRQSDATRFDRPPVVTTRPAPRCASAAEACARDVTSAPLGRCGWFRFRGRARPIWIVRRGAPEPRRHSAEAPAPVILALCDALRLYRAVKWASSRIPLKSRAEALAVTCMIGAIVDIVTRRRAVRREAEDMLRIHGSTAWDEARRLAWQHRDDEERATHYLRVASYLDRKLGIAWQADSATRRP